jgi:hypothetical protein
MKPGRANQCGRASSFSKVVRRALLQLGDFALPLAMREYMPWHLVSGAGIVRLRGAETGQIRNLLWPYRVRMAGIGR